jgi:hypothetical protein
LCRYQLVKRRVGIVAVRAEAVAVVAAAVRAAVAVKVVVAMIVTAGDVAVRTGAAARAIVVSGQRARGRAITAPGAVAIVLGVGLVTVIATATEIKTVTENVGERGIVTEIAMISSRAAHAFTSPQIMGVIDIAPVPMTGATRTVCTRARTMRAEGKAMTRSAHTFTGMALPASSLLSATGTRTNRLIGTASRVVIKKDTETMKCTSVADAFTRSCSSIRIS